MKFLRTVTTTTSEPADVSKLRYAVVHKTEPFVIIAAFSIHLAAHAFISDFYTFEEYAILDIQH